MKNKLITVIIYICVFMCLLSGFQKDRTGSGHDPAASEEQDWRDYNGKRIGVMVGTPMEKIAKDYFPDSEYVYLNSYPDCNAAILSGKINL